MVLPSSHIASLIAQQQSMFSGQVAYAQQLSYPMMAASGGYAAPPPPPIPPAPAPPPMSMMSAMDYNAGGMYGEQLASRVAGAGRVGLGVGSAAAGIGMGFMGIDPFSIAMRTGSMSLGGIGTGLLAGGAAMLPAYAMGKAVDAYSGAFSGGMQDQAQLNSTLRNNFRFYGGDGAMGRGFGQAQMGQIGQMMQGITRSDPFTNMGELSSLVGGGADAGMLTGVRDVQDFSNKFRKMLDTLKTVQRELGGTLTDALGFVRQSKQLGMFQQADQMNFASTVRSAEASTGLSRDQLFQLSSSGAQMSRAVGGYGRQGAYGAVRTASTLGAAVQSGAINEELLSEATGGLTGAEAIQSMTMNIMNRSARFSRRSMGRFSLFSMSNEDGTGLDGDMLERFRAGDLTTGEVSRSAHSRVNRMGRARAIRQEGVLRGAMMEEGGLAGQIGMMRLMVGDRVMDQGDDLANVVMQRRFGMGRSEAELMTSLMRNQGNIASQEGITRELSGRDMSLRNDLRENRSVDAFMRNMGHAVQEATGTAEVREMGRRFVTRLSSIAERAMNDVLGVTENQLTGSDLRSVRNVMRGRGTQADFDQISAAMSFGGAGGSGMSGADAFSKGLLQTGLSTGEVLQRRGVGGVREMSGVDLRTAVLRASQARRGVLTDTADLQAFKSLNSNEDQTRSDIIRAQFMASSTSQGSSDFYRYMGTSRNANAVDAWMMSQGMSPSGIAPGAGALLSRGRGGFLTAAVRASSAMARGGIGDALSSFEDSYTTSQERGVEQLASGGATARAIERAGGRDLDDAGTAVGMFFRGDMLTDRVRERARGPAGRLDRLATSFGQVRRNTEGMSALVGNDEARRHLSAIASADGVESMTRGLSAFRRYVGGIEDEGQKQAAGALLMRMESEQQDGQLSSELRGSLQAALVNPERAQQMRDELDAASAGYSNLGQMMRGVQGGTQGLGAQFSRVSRAYAQGDVQEANRLTLGAQLQFARLDTGSDEYRRYAETAGRQGETGQAFMQEVAGVRQLQRALGGRGRRGGAQQAETALNMLTGGTLGEMEITDREGGRALNARQIQAALRRGGAGADRVMNQLQANMAGVEGAGDMLEQYRQSISDGTMSNKEVDSLITGVRGNKDLQQLQQRAVEQRQRQQNPLDTERNDVLKQILTAIKNANSEGGVPTGEKE